MSVCALALPGPVEFVLLGLLFAGYAGLTFLAAIVAFARKAKHRNWILLLCFIGLFVPIAWLGLILWAAMDDLEEPDRKRAAFEVVGTPSFGPIHVREAVDADAGAVAEIDRLATADLRQVYQPTAAAIDRKAQMSSTFRRIVASSDGRVIGTVKLVHEDNRLHLMALAVHPGWRRRGVARAIVEWTARHARENGSARLSLYTVVETGNVAVFEKLGFHVVRTEPAGDFEPTGLSEAYMERPIDA